MIDRFIGWWSDNGLSPFGTVMSLGVVAVVFAVAVLLWREVFR